MIFDREYCPLEYKKHLTNPDVLKPSIPLVLKLLSLVVETNYPQMPCLIYRTLLNPNLALEHLNGSNQCSPFFQCCCYHSPLIF